MPAPTGSSELSGPGVCGAIGDDASGIRWRSGASWHWMAPALADYLFPPSSPVPVIDRWSSIAEQLVDNLLQSGSRLRTRTRFIGVLGSWC